LNFSRSSALPFRVEGMNFSIAARWEPDRGWSVLASFFMHLVMFTLVVYLVPASSIREPIEKIVAVTIVRPPPPPAAPDQTADPVVGPPPPDASKRSGETVPGGERPAPRFETVSAGGMIQPSVLLSDGVLSTPEAEQARLALPTLAEYDRRLQLCGLEAMEQIEAWESTYKPERLVAYAMQDTRIRGNRVTADGAAFRSRGNWYNLRFECEVTPDIGKVVSFRFAVGDTIPYGEWAQHNLPAQY